MGRMKELNGQNQSHNQSHNQLWHLDGLQICPTLSKGARPLYAHFGGSWVLAA